MQWADPAAAAGGGSSAAAGGRCVPPSFQAQNPLVERIGKDAFNTVSDLRAAVDGKAFREACQILVAMAQRDAGELCPTGTIRGS